MFYFELSSLALKTRLLIHLLECKSKFVLIPTQQPAAAAARTIRRRISPMIKFIREAFQYQMQHDPAAAAGETFSRLSFDTFLRARAPSDQFRSCENKSYATSRGWLTGCACACACIELNIIFSLMNFPHKSCTFNFNAFEKCVSMLNSQLYYGHRSKCNGFKVFNSRFSKR